MSILHAFRIRVIASTLALAAGLGGCAGVDTGNGAPARIQMALSVGEVPPVDQGGATFQVEAASLFVRHLELYLPAGLGCADVAPLGLPAGVSCDLEKLRVTGPFRVNLLTGVATPPLPSLTVPAGTYSRVDVRFEEDELTDVTLVASGTVPVDGVSRPWRLAVELDEDVRFEGMTIDALEGALARALLGLDMSQWFAALPLSACAAAGTLPVEGGVIVLSDGDEACVDIEDVIKAAIRGSAVLLDDDHDDGED